MQWSRYMQSPLFLEMTRKYYLSSQNLRPVIRGHLEVHDTMQILDVACGSGFFTRLLAEGLSSGKVCGVDLDCDHIQAVQPRVVGCSVFVTDIPTFTRMLSWSV